MSEENIRNGLLIDYEYCTGCLSCEVACAQEFKRRAGETKGIKVFEFEQRLPKGKGYISYLPFPTELCVLCPHLTNVGERPACEKACMAACITYGPVKDLAKEMEKKPKMSIWTPR